MTPLSKPKHHLVPVSSTGSIRSGLLHVTLTPDGMIGLREHRRRGTFHVHLSAVYRMAVEYTVAQTRKENGPPPRRRVRRSLG